MSNYSKISATGTSPELNLFNREEIEREQTTGKLTDIRNILSTVIQSHDPRLRQIRPVLAPNNDVSYNVFRERQKAEYIRISKEREEKNAKWKEDNLTIYRKGKRIPKKRHASKTIARNQFLKNLFLAMMIQKTALENGLVPLLVTVTLPSGFHPYTTHDRHGNPLLKPYRNRRYDRRNTVEIGKAMLQTYMEDIGKSQKRYGVEEYVRVIEFHQSFVPHLHALFFLPSDQVEAFTKLLQRRRAKLGLGKQFKAVLADDPKKGVAYMLKYVQKSLDPKNDDDFHMVNGWKKAHKIRMYTGSQIDEHTLDGDEITRYILNPFMRAVDVPWEDGENIVENAVQMLVNGDYDLTVEREVRERKGLTKKAKTLLYQLNGKIDDEYSADFDVLLKNPEFFRDFFSPFYRNRDDDITMSMRAIIGQDKELRQLYEMTRKKPPNMTIYQQFWNRLKKRGFLWRQYVDTFRLLLSSREYAWKEEEVKVVTRLCISKRGKIIYDSDWYTTTPPIDTKKAA